MITLRDKDRITHNFAIARELRMTMRLAPDKSKASNRPVLEDSGAFPSEHAAPAPRRNPVCLTSQDRLLLVPCVGTPAMGAGDGLRLQVRSREAIFVDHHAGDVKFFRYRTSHQDSLYHGANISQDLRSCAGKLRSLSRLVRGSGVLPARRAPPRLPDGGVYNYGNTAKTRAGKPEPPCGFGNVATTIAPASGT